MRTLTLGIIGSGLPSYLLADNSKEFADGIEIKNGIKIFQQPAQKSLEALAHTIIPSTKHIEIKNIFINYISTQETLTRYYNIGINRLNNISMKYYKKKLL
ncbi:MAG: hypothetical protein ACR2NW_10055 [Thermodesulfobacteriota bacterium]